MWFTNDLDRFLVISTHESNNTTYPPPLCISYANVHNYYGPYAYGSLAIEQWKVQQ